MAPPESAQQGGDDDYEPYSHRKVEKPTTNCDTLIHLLKGAVGTGVLVIPKAFSNAGLVSGILLTILVASLCVYGIHVLVRTIYLLCKRDKMPSYTYPNAMGSALSKGPWCLPKFKKFSVFIVEVSLIMNQLGIASSYVVFVTTNIKEIIEYHKPDFQLDQRIYMLIMATPFISVNLVKNLKYLVPFSALANVLLCACFSIVFYNIFVEGGPLTIKHCDFFGTWLTTPLFIGSMFFALEAIGLVMSLENNMKTPASFGGYFGVFNQGSIIVVSLYGIIGVAGYLKYGNEIKGSITTSIPIKDFNGRVMRIMFAIAVFFTHPLQCYVPLDIFWHSYIDRYIENPKFACCAEYTMRSVVVMSTVVFAIAVPKLDLLISLTGAVCISGLGLSYPALMEMCYYYNAEGLKCCSKILIRDVLLILAGFVAFVLGTASTVLEIIKI